MNYCFSAAPSFVCSPLLNRPSCFSMTCVRSCLSIFLPSGGGQRLLRGNLRSELLEISGRPCVAGYMETTQDCTCDKPVQGRNRQRFWQKYMCKYMHSFYTQRQVMLHHVCYMFTWIHFRVLFWKFSLFRVSLLFCFALLGLFAKDTTHRGFTCCCCIHW